MLWLIRWWWANRFYCRGSFPAPEQSENQAYFSIGHSSRLSRHRIREKVLECSFRYVRETRLRYWHCHLCEEFDRCFGARQIMDFGEIQQDFPRQRDRKNRLQQNIVSCAFYRFLFQKKSIMPMRSMFSKRALPPVGRFFDVRDLQRMCKEFTPLGSVFVSVDFLQWKIFRWIAFPLLQSNQKWL